MIGDHLVDGVLVETLVVRREPEDAVETATRPAEIPFTTFIASTVVASSCGFRGASLNHLRCRRLSYELFFFNPRIFIMASATCNAIKAQDEVFHPHMIQRTLLPMKHQKPARGRRSDCDATNQAATTLATIAGHCINPIQSIVRILVRNAGVKSPRIFNIGSTMDRKSTTADACETRLA